MNCRKPFEYLRLTLTALCLVVPASPLLAQCQALFLTVPVPGSIADAGATCLPAALVDLGNGAVADRANHLLWAKTPYYPLFGGFSDFEIYCGQLVLGGRTGWYIPDVAQLQTLLPPGTCQAVMDGCGTGNPDYEGYNGVTWSTSTVSPDSYYCPAGFGCPYYGWQVATGLGTNFGYLRNVSPLTPRKRVDAGTYADSGTVRCVASGLNLAITPAPVTVPAGETLLGGNVKTRSHLALELTDGVGPVSGVLLTLRTSRPTADLILGPIDLTGADGSATADVSTRLQPNVSTIDSTTPLVFTNPKGVVTWLPAKYESTFLTTCYRTDLESDYTDSFIQANKFKWCGTTPAGRTYRQTFMDDVRIQGSGISVQSEVIKFEPKPKSCYYFDTCPTTSSGACAQVGVSAAVDRTVTAVIPFGGTINIDTLGTRLAQDTGNGITSYHIDIYNGVGKAVCLGWSNPNLAVTFVSY